MSSGTVAIAALSQRSIASTTRLCARRKPGPTYWAKTARRMTGQAQPWRAALLNADLDAALINNRPPLSYEEPLGGRVAVPGCGGYAHFAQIAVVFRIWEPRRPAAGTSVAQVPSGRPTSGAAKPSSGRWPTASSSSFCWGWW